MTNTEVPLSGGNSNASVVRSGNTVRRSVGPTSATVHRLLRFLEREGFDRAPRFLGIDERGREILGYLEGSCGIRPDYWNDEKYLTSAAKLLRDLHATTARYVPRGDERWGYVHPDAAEHEVICHNDFAPYNLIADATGFTGVIDFDLAGPGPRRRDVAYAAYWFTPVSRRAHDMRTFAKRDLRNGSARLKRFCELCGVPANAGTLDAMQETLCYMADEAAMVDSIGRDATERLKAEGHLAHWAGEASAFERHRPSIEANLLLNARS